MWTARAASLSQVVEDARLLGLTGLLFDGLYKLRKRAVMLGREPA